MPQIFTQAATGTQLYLALPLTDIRNSLVVITVNAASLTLVTNESPARITSAEAGASLCLPCAAQDSLPVGTADAACLSCLPVLRPQAAGLAWHASCKSYLLSPADRSSAKCLGTCGKTQASL